MKWNFDKNRKHPCPACQRKTFVKLIDEQGNYLPDEYGKCDRYNKCGYKKYPPKSIEFDTHYLPKHYLTKIVENNLYNNELLYSLDKLNLFDTKTLFQTFELYRVYTIKHSINPLVEPYYRSPVFFFFDKKNETPLIYYGQVVKYNGINRSKSIPPHSITKLLKHLITNDLNFEKYLHDYENAPKKRKVLFGWHLLRQYENLNHIFIVESPKTALVCTAYYGLPEDTNAVFLATGGSSIDYDTLYNLTTINTNCSITLIPDCDKQNKFINDWKSMINRIPSRNLIVMDIQGNDGDDIADLIIEKKAPILLNK